jgi:hypothetical protein
VPDDLVAAAVAELYAGSPDAFTTRRAELAADARAAGDRAAAAAIAALRRPTRAAWVVNQLTRSDPAAPRQLTELSAALLAAQQAGDGARLRELSAARAPLLDALADAAFRAAGLTGPPPALRGEVTATLEAALADPEVAAGLAAGTLTKSAQWAGFGQLPASAVPPQPAHGGQAAAARERGAEERAEEEAHRLAAAAAELTARRRLAFKESERALAVALAATAEAETAEERLEAEVRGLEERLTRARAELAVARMRARRAEAAERRARQAVDRLATHHEI